MLGRSGSGVSCVVARSEPLERFVRRSMVGRPSSAATPRRDDPLVSWVGLGMLSGSREEREGSRLRGREERAVGTVGPRSMFGRPSSAATPRRGQGWVFFSLRESATDCPGACGAALRGSGRAWAADLDAARSARARSADPPPSKDQPTRVSTRAGCSRSQASIAGTRSSR